MSVWCYLTDSCLCQSDTMNCWVTLCETQETVTEDLSHDCLILYMEEGRRLLFVYSLPSLRGISYCCFRMQSKVTPFTSSKHTQSRDLFINFITLNYFTPIKTTIECMISTVLFSFVFFLWQTLLIQIQSQHCFCGFLLLLLSPARDLPNNQQRPYS